MGEAVDRFWSQRTVIRSHHSPTTKMYIVGLSTGPAIMEEPVICRTFAKSTEKDYLVLQIHRSLSSMLVGLEKWISNEKEPTI